MCYAKNGVRGKVTGFVSSFVSSWVRGFEYCLPAAAWVKSYGLG
jgi:hypothetical protein